MPELKPGADAVPLSAYPKEQTDILAYGNSISVQIPKQIPGSRLVLFLKHRNLPEGSADSNGQEETLVWQPSNSFQDMKTAAVWIEGTKVYCFQQLVNPGPSFLFPVFAYEEDGDNSKWKLIKMTVTDLRTRVDHVIEVQQQLRTAVQVKDPHARAEQLRNYVQSDVKPAQSLAFEELGKAGQSALPVLRAMLDDPEYVKVREAVMHAYVQAGGVSLGKDLSARLESELAFWKAIGPTLAQGWWNQDVRPDAPLRQQYSETLEILRGLQTSHPASALNTAIELGDLWRSLPQLNDPGGLYQLADECDKLVQQIR